MAAAVESRHCVVCGVDISHKRRHARFCGSTCRGLELRGEPYDPPGNCETCGALLATTRGSYCSDACRARARRGRNGSGDRSKTLLAGSAGQMGDQPQDGPLRARRCGCERSAPFENEDGGARCIWCGRRAA
jgi:hypothetical protein